ncbi:hypothetical protein L1F30_15540 [Simiduia sp. 21SJ11W-1]|uniref:hypothetical protein n=1 Tax=Simiduia sp. 21SJ11W-1 TaxID=2909669 RepID=UPI0020A066F9|nr:hypothetical protein [Simiduia sp. 21SJ11W-1]UTA47554.1 hypothetical protein L1F30_15540 [Simiduia sp. 21SJ11W-1]
MTHTNNNKTGSLAPLTRLLARMHPFAFTLALSLAALLACGWQLHVHFEQQTQSVSQRYGQALANLAAEQAESAMLNQDRVSLTALLADLTENLDVEGATVHDVENRLLVQSGHTTNPRSLHFSAPVVLQDSVAGYITVTVSADTARANRHRLYGRLALTLAALLALTAIAASLYRHPDFPEPEPAAPAPSAPDSKVTLTLDLLNLEQLHTELNGEAFKQLLERFERQLQGVIALYGGESLGLQNHQLTLMFTEARTSDASFNAICSAELLHSLSEHSELALQLGARILPFEASANLKSQYAHQLKPGGMRATIISVKLLDESLSERAQFAARADQRSARVEQVLPPYKKLLENQLAQLASLASAER